MKKVAQVAQLRAAFECILIKHGEIEDSNRFLWWNDISSKYGEILKLRPKKWFSNTYVKNEKGSSNSSIASCHWMYFD